MMKTDRRIDMNMKNVNCEFLSTNSNKTTMWVHRLPDGRLFTVFPTAKPHGYEHTLPQEQFLFGRISDDDGRSWGDPFYLYT